MPSSVDTAASCIPGERCKLPPEHRLGRAKGGRRGAILVLVFAVSCAPGRPPPGTPVGEVVVSPDPRAELAPEGAPTDPSLLALTDPRATLVVRLDAPALRATALYRGFEDGLRAAGALVPLDAASRACGSDVVEALGEMMYSERRLDQESVLVVARVGLSPQTVYSCLRHLEPALVETTFEALPALRVAARGPIIVMNGGVLFYGAEKAVRGSLARARGQAPREVRVAPPPPVKPGAALSFSLAGTSPHDILASTGTLEIARSHLGFAASADLSTEGEVDELAVEGRRLLQTASAMGKASLSPDLQADLERIMGATRIEHQSKRLLASSQVALDALAQARLGSAAAAYLHDAIRRFQAAEASGMVDLIASALAFSMERKDAKGRSPTRFPPSAPRVPAVVPKGRIAPPDVAGWSHPSWVFVDFRMPAGSYYSYEYFTAKDGRSVTVVATGDLDGDDKQSSFRRTVTLQNDGRVEKGPLTVTDELE